MQDQQLIPHLFRTEFSKIVSVLTKSFGMELVDMAEDIASETFLAALETWPYQGMPKNPTAWLYTVAKNKAVNLIHHQHVFSDKIAKQIRLKSSSILEIDLSDHNISDSQLQMLFALCYPSIGAEAQVGLALRILCGFGIEEIANAFLSNKETINKRLFRAKEKLRQEKVKIEIPSEADISSRLETVLTTLYLLFNEGYYSESQDSVLREDLCLEAIRLTHLLVENESTNRPATRALLALMCFHASRFGARRNARGEIVLYQDQDPGLWNQELIAKGAYFLREASGGRELTKYHLEASIAYWHTIREDTKEKWENILQLFNHLLSLQYSPIAALNRTYALAKARSKAEAIVQAERLNLSGNHFYHMLLGELYLSIDDSKARSCLDNALALAKTETDRQTIQKKIDSLVET